MKDIKLAKLTIDAMAACELAVHSQIMRIVYADDIAVLPLSDLMAVGPAVYEIFQEELKAVCPQPVTRIRQYPSHQSYDHTRAMLALSED